MEKTHQILDFYCAAYLVLKQHELIQNHRSNGKTIFTFRLSDSLSKDILGYYSMKSSIEPVAYSGVIRNLKTIIHSNRPKQQLSTSSSEELNNEFNSRERTN